LENETSQKEVMEQIQKILEERGREALEMARKTVLEEEIESKEVRKALKYFLTDYWHDVARPAILSLVCEAVGGDPTVTTPIAIPMTLISGAIDIHDDIIDGSENKGSRPTVLGKFGKDIALLVGDALLFKGFTTLYEAVEKGISAKKVAVINDIIKRTFFELGDAEALELEFRGQIDITPEEYLNVVRKKAADVEAHTRISAILGDGTEEEVEALSQYGRLLGILIILRDEIIDMIDIEESMHRIKKEHLSLPVIYALQNPKINSEISLLISKKITTKNDVQKLLALAVKGMGFSHVEDYMKGLAQDAYTHVERVKNNRKFLLLLIRRMLLPEWQKFI
jgi:geranylgeranyl diphosphate synthase type I